MSKNRVCANSAVLPRRTFLTGAAATPMLCASPALAKTEVGSETKLTDYERGFKDAQRRILDIMQDLADQNIPTDPKHSATHEMWDLFENWMTDRKKLVHIPDHEDQRYDQELKKVTELEKLILTRTPLTGTDMLIKVMTYTSFGAFHLSKGLSGESVAFLGLADDPRAAM